MTVAYTVFSKPWKEDSLPAMARKIRALGFEGIELPVRPGFQVQPPTARKDLPEAARILREEGIRIGSVAADPGEEIIEACGLAGVPILRVLVTIPPGAPYLATIDEAATAFEKLLPALREQRVTIGLQNHCGRQLSSVMAVLRILERFDPAQVAGVLDFGHCGIAGETPDLAMDALENRLCLVNFKNALRRRLNGPEAVPARWGYYWTGGRHGLADWPAATAELTRRAYEGDICLTAEYSDADSRDRLLVEDLAWLRELMDQPARAGKEE